MWKTEERGEHIFSEQLKSHRVQATVHSAQGHGDVKDERGQAPVEAGSREETLLCALDLREAQDLQTSSTNISLEAVAPK